MHEVAVSTTVASILLILPAGGFSEVCDRGEVDNNWTTCIKSPSEILKCICSMLFLPKLNIHITNHVVSQIVADIQALKFTILAQFLKEIFIEVLEVILDLTGIDGLALDVDAGGDHIRSLVHVG